MKMYGVALLGHSKVYIAIYFSPFLFSKIYSKPICIKAEDTK